MDHPSADLLGFCSLVHLIAIYFAFSISINKCINKRDDH